MLYGPACPLSWRFSRTLIASQPMPVAHRDVSILQIPVGFTIFILIFDCSSKNSFTYPRHKQSLCSWWCEHHWMLALNHRPQEIRPRPDFPLNTILWRKMEEDSSAGKKKTAEKMKMQTTNRHGRWVTYQRWLLEPAMERVELSIVARRNLSTKATWERKEGILWLIVR